MSDRFKFRVWNKREDCYIVPPNPQPLLQSNGLLAYFTEDTKKAMDFYKKDVCGEPYVSRLATNTLKEMESVSVNEND